MDMNTLKKIVHRQDKKTATKWWRQWEMSRWSSNWNLQGLKFNPTTQPQQIIKNEDESWFAPMHKFEPKEEWQASDKIAMMAAWGQGQLPRHLKLFLIWKNTHGLARCFCQETRMSIIIKLALFAANVCKKNLSGNCQRCSTTMFSVLSKAIMALLANLSQQCCCFFFFSPPPHLRWQRRGGSVTSKLRSW